MLLDILCELSEPDSAVDVLLQAEIEDMAECGRKLFLAVKAWQLARSVGFKEARTILRPAIDYLVKGPRDRTAYESILRVLGKEWVDLDGLASGGRPLDDEGRTKVLAVTAAASESACIEAILALLREGYAATSVAEGLAVDAARRIVASPGYDTEAARRLLFAHASRFVLSFSRTNERLYALFQAALRLRSPEPSAPLPAPASAASEGDELCHLAGEFDDRKPREAAARVRAYVARGYSTSRMLDEIGRAHV